MNNNKYNFVHTCEILHFYFTISVLVDLGCFTGEWPWIMLSFGNFFSKNVEINQIKNLVKKDRNTIFLHFIHKIFMH